MRSTQRASVLVAALLLASGAWGQTPEDLTDEGLAKLIKEVVALRAAGKSMEAVPLANRLAKAAPRFFGEENPLAASCLNLAGLVYDDAGQYAKAEPLYQRALQIREAKLGKDHPDVASSLNNLAGQYHAQGQYAKAESLYQRSLLIREAKLGKDHPDVALNLNNLAVLYYYQAQYAKAEPLLQRSLLIREAKLSKDHPDLAQSLNNLAGLYHAQGQYAKAESLYQRSLLIREARLGKDHPDVALNLNNLAALYSSQGQYAKAEPLYQRSLQIREAKLGKDHPDVAVSLNNLAMLYQTQGQYAKAEPLFQRSLLIWEAKLGKDHPDVASSLHNLATLYDDMGQYAKAEPLYQRSLQIREAKLGKDHPDVAVSLNNLAMLHSAQGQYTKAETLYQRSLLIWEAKLGKDHPRVATSLNNLAWLYSSQGQYAKAEPLYQRSLQIREAKLGKDHPDVALSLNHLAGLFEASDRSAEAADLKDRARRISARHVTHVLPALSQTEQATFLLLNDQGNWHTALSLGLRHADMPGLAAHSAGWLLNGKSLLQQTATETILLARDSHHPATADLATRLRDLRQRLARLAQANPQPGQEQDRLRLLEQLIAQEQDLVKQLRQAGQRTMRPDPWVELDELRRRLPSDSVFIDVARFGVYDFKATEKQKQWQPAHYAAWITPKQGPVHLLDLGPAQAIDDAVRQLRQVLEAGQKTILRQGEPETEQALRQPLETLSKLVLQPLLPHAGKSPNWIVSPDGNLWLVPWAALTLPDGKYAVEKHTITYAVSGRDIVNAEVRAPVKPSRPLVLADPDFDLGLDEAARLSRVLLGERPGVGPSLSGRKASGLLGEWKIHIEFHGDGSFTLRDQGENGKVYGLGRWSLQGDTLRAESEKSLYQARLDGQKLTGQRRLKDNSQPPESWTVTLDRLPEALVHNSDTLRSAEKLNRVPRLPASAAEAEQVSPRLEKYAGQQPRLHTDKEALSALFQAARNPRVVLLSTHGFFLPYQEIDPNERDRPGTERRLTAAQLENPLLRCGLLLAGCNNADKAQEGQDTGVLTGLQIVGTDLRGCELVVLSACETGLGDVRTGDGVAGLNQAFQLAGADSVVATLWKVPDQQSAQLMIGFFDNLARGQNRADALRQAQLALIKARRDRNAAAHPFFWAAFTLTGDPGAGR